ncbi:MAG: T9SS type A sorting domain-containing protein [Ignavibacteriales bacterium]|nr:T9SS type A sorting domain-containing protein [Ignavibacteriales bacterium]
MKSTNGGASWLSKDMNGYAYGLVDVHFFTADSGIAVGMTDSTNEISSGIILTTVDSGETWDTSYVSSQIGEWCWKISFPTRMVGYVSLQRNSGSPVNVLKTADGGLTWTEQRLADFNYYVQGIGFLDETTGWVGGNNTYPVYGTTDGGSTWASAGFGSRVNRFQFLENGEGYAVGQTVYKYTSSPTSVGRLAVPSSFVLFQNYPNPFNPGTVIGFQLSHAAVVRLSVFDMLGREVAVLLNEEKPPGRHLVQWDATGIPAGVYFSSLRAAGKSEVRKMVVVK